MASPESSRSAFAVPSVLHRVGRSAVSALPFLACALGAAAELAAQEGAGRITGRVLSSQNAEPLINAQVYVPGSNAGTLTGLDGRYVLRLPAGTHDLAVQYVGYADKTITGVDVGAGATVSLDISMAPRAIQFEAITVTATRERGSTTSLLTERMRAPLVVDAIGAEQISRSPDGDAAAALRRVTGVSVVDGKYVYVRGLGERYGSTTLNGAPLPSPEPDKKVVPLDLIPSSLLESVVTAKTYLPNQPGDYAGGLVQINTRDFSGLRLFKIGGSLGYNSVTSFKDGLGYAGGKYDFLGFDDGTRDLPSIIPPNRKVLGLSAADHERIGEAFTGDWGPTPRTLPVNTGVNLTFGDELELGNEHSVSFLGSVTQSSGHTRNADAIERVYASGDLPEVDYVGDVTTRSASLGALLNLGLRLAPAHRLSLATVYNRLADDESRIYEGPNKDSNEPQRNSRLRYLSQTLLNSQLGGEHVFGSIGDLGVKWRASYSRAGRDEPNTREILYKQTPDGRFLWENFIQSGSIFHQDMSEEGLSGGLDLQVPFRFRSLPASLSFGGAADLRARKTYTRRFRYLQRGAIADEIRARDPNSLFTPETISGQNGFELTESTFSTDNYDATQSILAAYGMLDVELLPRLRLVGGARIEQAEQRVDVVDLFGEGLPANARARLDDVDLLPAANLTYQLTDAMNLRLAVSQTVARPQLREIAPFAFTDYAGGFYIAGNTVLERSQIRNFDLRWEWFPRPGALLAISGFYKSFDAPIEVFILPSTEPKKTWVNADAATNFGMELELRSSLAFVAPALENLSVNGNLTLVESEVDAGGELRYFLPDANQPSDVVLPGRSRALQGQSPYVVNVGLSYYQPTLRTSGTVLFNRFGRRIDSVGSTALPDIYEEARDQLDVVVEQPLPRGFSFKVSASRLLGNEVEFTQSGRILRSYDTGRTIAVSASWSPGSE